METLTSGLVLLGAVRLPDWRPRDGWRRLVVWLNATVSVVFTFEIFPLHSPVTYFLSVNLSLFLVFV